MGSQLLRLVHRERKTRTSPSRTRALPPRGRRDPRPRAVRRDVSPVNDGRTSPDREGPGRPQPLAGEDARSYPDGPLVHARPKRVFTAGDIRSPRRYPSCSPRGAAVARHARGDRRVRARRLAYSSRRSARQAPGRRYSSCRSAPGTRRGRRPSRYLGGSPACALEAGTPASDQRARQESNLRPTAPEAVALSS